MHFVITLTCNDIMIALGNLNIIYETDVFFTLFNQSLTCYKLIVTHVVDIL